MKLPEYNSFTVGLENFPPIVSLQTFPVTVLFVKVWRIFQLDGMAKD